MSTIKRWKAAQAAETAYPMHQELSVYEDLEWVSDRFGVPAGMLFEGKTILEVGCGTGGLTYTLSEQSDSTVVGIDPILGKVDVQDLSTEPVFQAVGESLPFDDDRFDVVASINVLDHTAFPSTVLDEVTRVLKPGGLFLLKLNTFSLPRVVRRKLHLVDRPHPHHFSPSEIRTSLRSQGFDIEYESRRSQDSSRVNTQNFKAAVATLFFRMETRFFRCHR